MSERYVLDASALLCLLQDEKGHRVAEALPKAQIGAVNFSEAFGKLVEAGLLPLIFRYHLVAACKSQVCTILQTQINLSLYHSIPLSVNIICTQGSHNNQ